MGSLLIKLHAFNTMSFLRLMDLENFDRNFDGFLGGVRLQLHIVTEMKLKSEYEVGVR